MGTISGTIPCGKQGVLNMLLFADMAMLDVGGLHDRRGGNGAFEK